MGLSSLLTGGCSAMGQTLRPSFGIVVTDEVVQGTDTKFGVDSISDTGTHLFSAARAAAPNRPGMGGGGGTSSYAGAGLPKWVRVTWRTGQFVQRYDPTNNSQWTGGIITGDYKIEVASRIPLDVQQYASQGKGRAIRIRFRLHDEGVLLAWDVQELIPGNGIWTYSMQGGDFRSVTIRNNQIVEKGWYIHPKTGQRIETDF
jgi:hypothetical protein